MSVFGPEYALIYDAIYADKSYADEVQPLLKLLRDEGIDESARILDVGCGTGRHALALAELGFDVTGTDRSSAMLGRARARSGSAVSLIPADGMAAFESQFDLVYSLFDVLSYQTTAGDAEAFLSDLRKWTRPGGLVVADSWHLAGLFSDPPGPRRVTAVLPDGTRATRSSTATINWAEATTRVDYDVELATPHGINTFRETHVMRAYTKLEIELLLSASGLTPMRFFSVTAPDRQPDERDWHLGFVAKRPHV